eukprot:694944-Rhodomonas_salina.1
MPLLGTGACQYQKTRHQYTVARQYQIVSSRAHFSTTHVSRMNMSAVPRSVSVPRMPAPLGKRYCSRTSREIQSGSPSCTAATPPEIDATQPKMAASAPQTAASAPQMAAGTAHGGDEAW